MYASTRFVFVLLAACGICALVAADAPLGVATVNGEFSVDNARVSGNATVFDGTLIETRGAPSRVQLKNDELVGLAANSRARFHAGRIVLESGASEVAAAGAYEIEAAGLRIAPAAGATARVAHPKASVVEVAAMKGSLRVFDSRGLQIANVVPGTALSFEPQSRGAAPPSSFMGCLLKKSGVFIVYDHATRIMVELRGSQDFESQWGNRVQVVGATDTAARSEVGAQVVDVTSLTVYAQGGCVPVASAIDAELPGGVPAQASAQAPTGTAPQPTSTASTGGGMSAGTKVAIIAGVGAGAGAGIFAATKGGDDRSN